MRQERGRRNPEHQARLFEAPSGRPRWLNLQVDSQRKVIDLIAADAEAPSVSGRVARGPRGGG